jgi:glycosyltransferase involved in cell wall biosynthesis
VNAPLKVLHISTVDLGISFLLPQLRALAADGFEVHAACADGPLVESFEREGFKVHRVEVTRELTPLADLKLLWRLFRIIRRERYAVVHAHTPKMELVGQAAAWLARAPVILYTNHGLIFLGRAGALEGLMFKWVARVAGLFSDKVISQSAEDVSTVVRERIYPRRKVGFLGNGIRVSRLRAERFTPEQVRAKRRELGIPEGDKVVGMVGRYVWEKGYREFFEAARIILKGDERVSFVTVGVPLESERDPVDFSILRELGVEEKFFVLKSRGDMPELYALMDVVALPSYREGFPRSLMEAAAMSKPVVASDVSGCRQAVAEGENGFLVPVKDSEALASKIKLLLDSEALASRLGARGREIAEERFDVEKVIERLRDFYAELLKRKLPGYERACGVESYEGRKGFTSEV